MSRLYLKPPQLAEDDIHGQVARALDVLLLPPAEYTTFPAGGYGLTPQAAARLTRIGLKSGWPDVLVAYNGLYGIELKAGAGQLSKTRIVRSKRTGAARVIVGQVDMHARLRAAGVQIAVCRSVEAVLDQVYKWGIPTRQVRS